VEGYCASACTIAFLSGKERAAAPSAKLVFMRVALWEAWRRHLLSDEVAELRDVYRAAGLPDWFVEQIMKTPNDKMWHPSHDVLLSAGVLTRKSMGGETAALSTSVRSKEALVIGFKKIELFALLAERSPTDFANLIDVAWEKVQQGATDAEVTTAARAQLTAVLPRFLPLASDETLVAYQALMQEQLEALRERDVTACVEMAFPSGRPMIVVGNLPPELIKREMLLMTQVLREADAARSLKPSRQTVERVAQRAAAGMTQEEVVVFSDEATRQRTSPVFICDAAIKFFAGLNAIPMAERGRALRVLYAGS